MYDYRDLTGARRAAMIALFAYMVLDPLRSLLALAYPMPDEEFGPAEAAALPWLVSLLACVVLVCRWIYRANANAHAIGDGMTVSPAWSIGWFFVPSANLFMPYQAMKETWRESHEAAGMDEEAGAALLPWWWGLWIGSNVLNNLSFMFGGRDPEALDAAAYVDLISSSLSVPLSLVLIALMRRVTFVQDAARHAGAFA